VQSLRCGPCPTVIHVTRAEHRHQDVFSFLEHVSNTLATPTEHLPSADSEGALVQVLAVSDIVIYVTRAERLHQDMFSFLEDASAAYCKYFQKELEAAAALTCNSAAVSSVGPALVLFHETRNTEVLLK